MHWILTKMTMVTATMATIATTPTTTGTTMATTLLLSCMLLPAATYVTEKVEARGTRV